MTKLHNMRVYEDDIPGAISVPAKAEPNTWAGLSGVNTTKSPALGCSKMVKKARKS